MSADLTGLVEVGAGVEEDDGLIGIAPLDCLASLLLEEVGPIDLKWLHIESNLAPFFSGFVDDVVMPEVKVSVDPCNPLPRGVAIVGLGAQVRELEGL